MPLRHVFLPFCFAVAGSMDSGKSTLVAVLTHGADGRPLLDNGRGSARMAVFRHKHEIESGRTSSISQQVRVTELYDHSQQPGGRGGGVCACGGQVRCCLTGIQHEGLPQSRRC